MDWALLFGLIGTIVGVIALGWQISEAVIKHLHRPNLTIHPFDPTRDVRTFKITSDGSVRRFVNLHVTNKGRRTATRAVATLEITKAPDGYSSREPSFSLHWSGVEDSGLSSGAEPVDIGGETRRLDVVFTDRGRPEPGCWVAYPLSLAHGGRNQGYLPPGTYELLVRVTFDGGKTSEVKLRVESPALGSELTASAVPV